MTHSRLCKDPTTYSVGTECVRCDFKPGYKVTPNCGRDDFGGRHEPPFRECAANSFNDGSRAYCQECASCPHGSKVIRTCNSTTDTECELRSWITEVKVATNQGTNSTPIPTGIVPPSTFTTFPTAPGLAVIWTVPLSIVICIMLLLLCAYIVYMKRNKGMNPGRHPELHFRSLLAEEGIAPLSVPTCIDDILSLDIQSAPLQTVLDNLDVLEELVILLDPESQAGKNTKHLASHCSFPSTWVTYTYSMKDIKSPLKAVLEGVTSKHPDWTVAHLAKLLSKMERNDAITILAQLKLNHTDV
nr:PREDICTED: IGF-like family receptor 1 isoform X1 [Paralichthys olivaceus]